MSYGTGTYGVGTYGVGEQEGLVFRAFPEPDHRPPRVRLYADTGSDDVRIAEMSITRDGQPIRAEVPVGGRRLVTFDYEAPYGVPLTYEVEGVALDASGRELSWSETWANGSAWTASGSWSYSGGAARTTANAATLARSDLPATVVRAEFAWLKAATLQWRSPSNALLARVVTSVLGSGAETISLWDADGVRVANGAYPAGSMVTVEMSPSLMSVSTPTATYSVPIAGLPGGLTLARTGATPSSSETGIGRIDVYHAATVEDPFSLSATTTLDSPCAWLVHPVVSMSVCIDAYRWRDDALNLQGTSAKTFSRPARMSRFDPPGRSRAVFFRHGPRQISEWEMTLFAPTADSLDALDAALLGQSPMLLRIPPSWRLDLPDDWYHVGDFSAERVVDALQHHHRRVTLALTPTEAPPQIVTRPWTWADVAEQFETWADVADEFETWAELEVGGW